MNDDTTLRDNLADQFAEFIRRRAELLEAFEHVPEPIAHDEIARNAADFVLQLRALEKAAEDARVTLKAPVLHAGRVIDAFFLDIIQPLHTARRSVEWRLTDYQRKANVEGPVRGEYGSVASMRKEWQFEDVDVRVLDLEKLRIHFSEDCLARAIRSFIKTGGRELTGARIFQAEKTIVR